MKDARARAFRVTQAVALTARHQLFAVRDARYVTVQLRSRSVADVVDRYLPRSSDSVTGTFFGRA